jgi:hypothetical protein
MMNISIAALILIVVSAFLACSLPSQPVETDKPGLVDSNALVELSLAELVAHANCIVIGLVSSKISQWDAGKENIYTYVVLAVEERLKGELTSNQIVVKVPGGEIDGEIQFVEDTASFRVGERVLVFLKCDSDGTAAAVIGGRQGKLLIRNGRVINSNLSVNELIFRIKTEINRKSNR